MAAIAHSEPLSVGLPQKPDLLEGLDQATHRLPDRLAR